MSAVTSIPIEPLNVELSCACGSGDLSVVMALLRIGAQAEANAGIALMSAIVSDHLSVVTALLILSPQAFADPGNRWILTRALDVAARQTGANQPAIVKKLDDHIAYHKL